MATPITNTGPFGIPPGGPWFVEGASGTIQRQSNPILAEGLATAGWKGFATQAQAQAFANTNPIGQVKTAAKATFSGINAVGDFFNKLSEGNTWLRIGEAVLGIVIIALALGKLTGIEDTVKVATKSAVKAVK